MKASVNTFRSKFSQHLTKDLFLGFAAASSLWAGDALAGGTFYAIKPPTAGGNFELYKVEVSTTLNTAQASLLSTSTSTCSSCGSSTAQQNRINAFSYNPAQNNVFFFNSNTSTPTLYSVQAVAGGLFQELGTVAGLPASNLAAAAFFNNNIYVVANNSATLYRIPVTYGAGGSITVGSAVAISLGTGNRAYGDIAIDPATQTLYGYTTQTGTDPNIVPPAFYRYDLSGSGSLSFGPVNTSPSGVQIAFGNSDDLLYGVSTTGEWFTVDKASGVTSTFANTSGIGPGVFNDIAGGYPVPGPLPILGAAVAFRASRKLRSRVHQPQRSTVSV